jgi:hypothetical protein
MRVLRLAEYNGRVGQGIVHTKEYTEFMRQEQEWFNREHLDAEELHPLAPWDKASSTPRNTPSSCVKSRNGSTVNT